MYLLTLLRAVSVVAAYGTEGGLRYSLAVTSCCEICFRAAAVVENDIYWFAARDSRLSLAASLGFDLSWLFGNEILVIGLECCTSQSGLGLWPRI
ncbi:hypothetical protein VTL71DRAFT_9842, partial [Oculimacula yallundae]